MSWQISKSLNGRLLIHMNNLHPRLKKQYDLEIVETQKNGSSSIAKRIVGLKHGDYFNKEECYYFFYNRNENKLFFRLFVTVNDEIQTGKEADAKIIIYGNKNSFPKDINFNTSILQLGFVIDKELPNDEEIFNTTDVLHFVRGDPCNEETINILMDSLVDRILLREYINQNYCLTDKVVDMSREYNILELYPCMFIGFEATKFILPKNIKILYSNTFLGVDNPFDLDMKQTNIAKICKNTLNSIPLRSINFPMSLWKIDGPNFINCHKFAGNIDLSRTKIRIMEGIFNEMTISKLYLPFTLERIISPCFNKIKCKHIKVLGTNIQNIDVESFLEFKISSAIAVKENRLLISRIFRDDKIQDIESSITNIIFMEGWKKCSGHLLRNIYHPFVLNLKFSKIERLFPIDLDDRATNENISRIIIQNWKDKKIKEIILPETCKAISSSLLFLVYKR